MLLVRQSDTLIVNSHEIWVGKWIQEHPCLTHFKCWESWFLQALNTRPGQVSWDLPYIDVCILEKQDS